MSDAFAAAAAAQSASTSPAPAENTAAPASTWAGEAANPNNPFATAEETTRFSGGDWDPIVPYEDIMGRLVVFVPKQYRNDFPNRNEGQEGKVQDGFRCDIVVLDGGDLSFPYKEKDASNPDENAPWLDKTMNVPAADLPFTSRYQKVLHTGLIVQLKSLLKMDRNAENITFTYTPKLLMGIMSPAPYTAAKKKGATIESMRAEVDRWNAGGRRGTKPKHSWEVDLRITSEQQQLAMAWWSTFSAQQ